MTGERERASSSPPPSSRPRAVLLPADARTRGVRLLRELLRRQTFGAVARRVGVDERAVRKWASEECRPGRIARARMAEVLGIPETAWDEELGR